ncbi:WD40 repeat domain-containing protein [Actinomadura napierensis]|uniref:WD40 repeat domain-containing protein n=1 Tax=Actinomadura napierensis TaxID=267854 RepID=A0ABN2YXJ1_9ACTN
MRLHLIDAPGPRARSARAHGHRQPRPLTGAEFSDVWEARKKSHTASMRTYGDVAVSGYGRRHDLEQPLPSRKPINDIDIVEVDGHLLFFIAEYGGGAWIWNPAEHVWAKPPLRPPFEQYPDDDDPDVDCVAAELHDDRLIIVSGSENHAMVTWDLRSGELLREVDEEDDPVTSVTVPC